MLAWSASSDNVGVVEYGLYVAGLRVATVSEASATVTNLACGKSHLVGIRRGRRSRQSLGPHRRVLQHIRLPDHQPATLDPDGLKVAAATQTSVTLAWTASTDDVAVAGYGLYVAGSRTTQTANTSGVLGSAVRHHLQPGRRRIRQHRQALEPRTTVRGDVRMRSPPPPPGDTQPPAKPILSLGPATQTTLVLNWQPGSDNVGIDHYNVYRGTSDQAAGQ